MRFPILVQLCRLAAIASLAVVVAAPGLLVSTTTPATAQTAAKSTAPKRLSQTQQKIQDLKKTTQRWIEVDLTKQRVIAWEGKRWVDAMKVSTGKDSTPTPTGIYDVYVKYREARMQGDDYDIPDVPFVMYFSGGYGFHGAYWHNKFGTPVSHGCVNLAVDKADWLFHFASVGTPVVIHY